MYTCTLFEVNFLPIFSEIDKPRKLSGDGYIYYSNQLIQNVHFTWYNGISFRTRQKTGTLLYIVADRAETIHIEVCVL